MSEQILNRILNEVITVNQRLDRMDQRFDRVDQRLDGMDQRFDRVDQRLDGMDQRFDRMESEQKTLRAELHDFREETRADLQVLKAGQKGIRNEISDRFNEVKSELNNHEYSIHILNRRQLKLEADVEQLKESIGSRK